MLSTEKGLTDNEILEKQAEILDEIYDPGGVQEKADEAEINFDSVVAKATDDAKAEGMAVTMIDKHIRQTDNYIKAKRAMNEAERVLKAKLETMKWLQNVYEADKLKQRIVNKLTGG